MRSNARRIVTGGAAIIAIAVSAFMVFQGLNSTSSGDFQYRAETGDSLQRGERTAARRMGNFEGDTILCTVMGVIMLPGSESPTVLLSAEDNDIFLPIVVGPTEGLAISRAIENMRTPRPMTHDLLSTIIVEMGGEVRNITITKLERGTFYAEIAVDIDDRTIHIDARPSDSMALALKAGAPIYASVKVMEQAGERLDDDAPPTQIRPRVRPDDLIGDPI